jgi:hypothetical protein
MMPNKIPTVSHWLQGAMALFRQQVPTHFRQADQSEKLLRAPALRSHPAPCSRRVALTLPVLLLTGCPDIKPPKDPRRLPLPKAPAIDPPTPAPQGPATGNVSSEQQRTGWGAGQTPEAGQP